MGTHKDVELKVLASVCAYFEQLGPEARERCLTYLDDRYGRKGDGGHDSDGDLPGEDSREAAAAGLGSPR